MEPPFEMRSGRWFTPEEAQKAQQCVGVLGQEAAERLSVSVGETILVLTETDAIPVEVIGVVPEPNGRSLFVPMAAIERFSPTSGVDSVLIELADGSSPEEFRARWERELGDTEKAVEAEKTGEAEKAGKPSGPWVLRDGRQLAEAASSGRNVSAFAGQRRAATILSVLAAAYIIFTTLSMGVGERVRTLAILRAVGLTKGEVALAVLTEGLLLAFPGWLIGMAAGWGLLRLTGAASGSLDAGLMVSSAICALLGGGLAAILPICRACRVKPLDVFASARTDSLLIDRAQTRRKTIRFALLGALGIALDVLLVHLDFLPASKRLLLHSTLGLLLLAGGILLLTPALLTLTECLFAPILAFVFRIDRRLLRGRLTRNIGRTTAACASLTVGLGLFVSIQIWGYSMLGPFLPTHETPDSFAAFLPVGLDTDQTARLAQSRFLRPGTLLPIALEQANIAEEIRENAASGGMKFGNVIFFGVDISEAFLGKKPPIALTFTQGDRESALREVVQGRGCLVLDGFAKDYGLAIGNALPVIAPISGEKRVYKIAGILAFPGWQWLSKTAGVRRQTGRTDGIVFASAENVRNDFHLDRTGYFWFSAADGCSPETIENEWGKLAAENTGIRFASASGEKTAGSPFVKISTTEQLTRSIQSRADSVIQAMGRLPLIALVIMSLAVTGAVAASILACRREFGVLRAVGVTGEALLGMVLSEAILIAVTASILSFIFGLAVAAGSLRLGESVFGTSDPAILFPLGPLVFGFALTLGLATLAALHPAWRLVRESPMELLQ